MSKKPYPEVSPSPDFPKIESQVLEYWQKDGTFGKSVDSQGASKEFVFYDGPPFANGLPHYGHLLTGFVKDIFARYQTMRGKKVERRFGWDCHGLPAEMGSEKELGISGRNAIIKFGIGKFNEHCRTSVMKYTHEWEDYVTRQARWVDFKNDYKTMDINFMESVLWAFKQLYDKGLVYEAYRVMPYSWAAETPLSNFETKLDNSYREREDKAITVAFELNTPPHGAPKADKYYVLAWTTTPWTLPSNLALAVNVGIDYEPVVVRQETLNFKKGDCVFLAKSKFGYYTKELGLDDGRDLSKELLNPNVEAVKGQSLVGLSYRPLFPYFSNHKHAFKILDGSSFVTDGDGTGIVHIAPGFGEDDQRVAEANNIELVVPVDGQGKYTDEIFDLPDLKLKGLNVIAQTEGQKADEPYKEDQLKKFGLANLRIIKWLKDNKKLIKEDKINHNYPHCWRTDQPLIYRAMPSWYVEVTKFRDRAVELNKQINWIPEHIRDGQMGHMLATAPDWSISRNRFWGTPIPVWRSKSGKIKVLGSIAEIEKISGKKITDLHRPYIDEIIFTEGGEEYKRVEDVFDCWFESGSMPFAQVHYPFENKDWFEKHFPADFITEYVGQTRGWFNTLIMLSTALFDKPPFKNCVCHGVVLDSETGLKYSKRLKNYKDPMEVMDKFGADALRWLMISSPVMRGMDLSVDPEGKFIRDVVRLAIKPIWNAYNFFTLYANADGIKAKFATDSKDVMDRYILAKCKQAVETIQKSLDAYDTPSACDAVMQFFEALNNWYIRRNKERFWSSDKNDPTKQAAYDTLYTVLVTMMKAIAPLLPLISEEIYRGLMGEESVHLTSFPSMSSSDKAQSAADPRIHQDKNNSMDSRVKPENDSILIQSMDFARDVCNAALSIRNKQNIRVRQPLSLLKLTNNPLMTKFIMTGDDEIARHWTYLIEIIKDEVNVREVESGSDRASVMDYAIPKLQIKSAVLGKRLPEKMKQIIPASKKGDWKRLDDGQVEICGEIIKPFEEFDIVLEPKPEYKDRAQALSTNDALVILDLRLTPELEMEGIARDVVRFIQQSRKDANLNIADRIVVAIRAEGKIEGAIRANKQYIMEQVLATSLEFGSAEGKHKFESEMEEGKIALAFSVV